MRITKRLLFIICICLIPILCISCAKTTPEQTDTQPQSSEIAQVTVLDSLYINWMDEEKTYTAGSEITLDTFGRISQVVKRYEKLDCEYNENGLITKVTVTQKDDGKTGYETWAYDGTAPASGSYEPNNIRSAKETVYTTTTDSNGRITEILADITLTDSEDGSVSQKIDKYIYTYDANGRVATIDYYSDEKLDHTTTLTYDEEGNLIVYSNYGSSLGEYLRFEFTYKTVDAGTVNVEETDPFITVFNFESLSNHIL